MLPFFATAWFVVGEPSAIDFECRITTSSSSTTTRPAPPKPPAPATDEPRTPGKGGAQVSDAGDEQATKVAA
jgi:hypothetical protein